MWLKSQVAGWLTYATDVTKGVAKIVGTFVGCAENSKTYRLVDLDFNIIVKSRELQNFENKFFKDLEPIVDPTNGL